MENFGKNKYLNEFTDITLLKLSAFFHDIGKIGVKPINGVFKNHDTEGAKLFKKEISKNLSLGEKATNFVANLIKNHLSIFRLYYLKKTGSLQKKEINLWWYKNKEVASHLFLLSFADCYATSEEDMFLNEIIEFSKYIQEYYFNIYETEIIEQPLLTGKEIMDILNLKPSKKIGQIKAALQKAQIEGSIKTKQEAINFIKSFI